MKLISVGYWKKKFNKRKISDGTLYYYYYLFIFYYHYYYCKSNICKFQLDIAKKKKKKSFCNVC